MMNRVPCFRIAAIALAILLASRLSPARAERYTPKVGKLHSQIVLPSIVPGEAPIAITHYRGKKVLLVHFATWSEACREKLPLWYEATKQYVTDGKLVVIGIAQEQYADRCRLFAQWKGIDWPIMHDPLNLTGLKTLPKMVAVDEHGIVRHVKIDDAESLTSFVKKSFDEPKGRHSKVPPADTLPDPRQTRRDASEARDTARWCTHGAALIFRGKPQQIEEAIRAFENGVSLKEKDAAAWFGLGVAHRIRFDGPYRQPGDFQAAIDAWQKAAALRSSNLVYRARVQQFGPVNDKREAAYAWIPTARQALIFEEKTPVELGVEPIGTELLDPAEGAGEPPLSLPEGDPNGKIERDSQKLILCEATLVRATAKTKRRYVQVYLTFRPDPLKEAHWGNEAEPLQVWITQSPEKARVRPTFLDYPRPASAKSDELRTLCFEVRLPKHRKKGTVSLQGYALYNASAKEGKASYLRQDVKIEIPIAP